MATFALIHGAAHGAWCWERLVGELEARGHGAVAMDLPCEDAAAGAADYARVAVEALVGVDEEVVVVGHSLGGITAPLVAQARPTRRLVLLTPAIPMLGRSLAEALVEEPFNEVSVGELSDDGFIRFTEATATLLYNECSAEDVRWALERVRPQALTPVVEVTPLERFPDVPTSVVLGRHDRTMNLAAVSDIAVRRLGVEPMVLDSDHSPFLGRPAELADVLAGLA